VSYFYFEKEGTSIYYYVVGNKNYIGYLDYYEYDNQYKWTNVTDVDQSFAIMLYGIPSEEEEAIRHIETVFYKRGYDPLPDSLSNLK
jgi:hypothetical protein